MNIDIDRMPFRPAPPCAAELMFRGFLLGLGIGLLVCGWVL